MASQLSGRIEKTVTPSSVPAARLISAQSRSCERPASALNVPPPTASKNAGTTRQKIAMVSCTILLNDRPPTVTGPVALWRGRVRLCPARLQLGFRLVRIRAGVVIGERRGQAVQHPNPPRIVRLERPRPP